MHKRERKRQTACLVENLFIVAIFPDRRSPSIPQVLRHYPRGTKNRLQAPQIGHKLHQLITGFNRLTIKLKRTLCGN